MDKTDLLKLYVNAYKSIKLMLDTNTEKIFMSYTNEMLTHIGYDIPKGVFIKLSYYHIRSDYIYVQKVNTLEKYYHLGAYIECHNFIVSLLNLISICKASRLNKQDMLKLLEAICIEEEIELIFNFQGKDLTWFINLLYDTVFLLGCAIAKILYVDHKQKNPSDVIYPLYVIKHGPGDVDIMFTTDKLVKESINNVKRQKKGKKHETNI